MIDVQEIRDEISRLERSDTTYSQCERLAILHAVLDHYGEDTKTVRQPAQYSRASSEFEAAASAIPWETFMDVMNEHMQAVKAVFPREYAAVIRKLKNAQ